jgi:outer membrane protein assembly factor BamA
MGDRRLAWVPGALTLLLFAFAANFAFAQEPTTRTEEILQARRDKAARLWPERESPLVDEANRLLERGFYEGIASGQGANGLQLLLGGMRQGQGQSFGLGYRRGDLWQERLSMSGSARGTFQWAYMLDFEMSLMSLTTNRRYMTLYAKYENSPQMDYYGEGPFSSQDDRTSYRLEDVGVDLAAGVVLSRGFDVGGTVGWYGAHTRPGTRSGFPSTGEVFDPSGLEDDTSFLRWRVFAQYDTRDVRSGARSGGLYRASFRRYYDRELEKYSFSQLEFGAQHSFPYFNKSRVVAVRVYSLLSFEDDGQQVPFYLQPKLGGNDDLRGFARYRFYDDHMIFANLEHRWHAFSGLDMALFVDAGKVIPKKEDITFGDLRWSGGIGFRYKIEGNVFLRTDFAYGSEGFRAIATFSDIFQQRWYAQ